MSVTRPLVPSEEIESIDPGIVDPRMAAEAVLPTFLQSILKGRRRGRRIVTDAAEMQSASCLSARDISCLVIPDGCLGLPVLAALEQGIPVMGVRDLDHLMSNDLASLPWGPGQFASVDNYFEAVVVLCARKAGLAPDSLQRPIQPAPVAEVVRRRRAGRRGSASTPPCRNVRAVSDVY
jgi:hypothetical protein